MNKSLFFLLLLAYTCIGQVSFRKSSIFVPTEEWQEIGPDQSIPKGLHVRVNLETGKKEAKLLDDRNSSNKNQELIVVAEQQQDHKDPEKIDDMEEFIKALKHIKNDYDVKDEDEELVRKKFRTMAEIKAELSDVNFEFSQGPSLVSKFIQEFQEATQNYARIVILKDFEYILHELDAATDFTKLEGTSKVIFPGLNSTNMDVRTTTMSVISSAAQSNPSVQINFLDHKVLVHLTNLLSNEDDVTTQITCLYAISSLIRGFPYGQRKFIEIGGLDILLQRFINPKKEGLPLQIKVITLVRNLLEEKNNAIGQRADQLREVEVDRHLTEGGWCPVIPSLLPLSVYRGLDDGGRSVLRCDYDTVEPLVEVMHFMAVPCAAEFLSHEEKLVSLAEFLRRDTTRDDGRLYDAVTGLLTQIRSREEL